MCSCKCFPYFYTSCWTSDCEPNYTLLLYMVSIEKCRKPCAHWTNFGWKFCYLYIHSSFGLRIVPWVNIPFSPNYIDIRGPLYFTSWFLPYWLTLILLLCFKKTPTVYLLLSSMIYPFHVLLQSIIADRSIQDTQTFSGPLTTQC